MEERPESNKRRIQSCVICIMLKLIGVMTAGHALNEEVEVNAINFARTMEECNFSCNSKLLDDPDAVGQRSLEHTYNKFQISLV